MYVPVLRDIFGFAPLGTSEWIFLAAFAPALLILEETRKKVIRRYLHTG
jgi:hypothetical protein